MSLTARQVAIRILEMSNTPVGFEKMAQQVEAYAAQEVEAAVERLRPYLRHKAGCPAPLRRPNSPYEGPKCDSEKCGLWNVDPEAGR